MKPGYKQTEVGVIREEWEVSTVGREFEAKLGKMLDSEKNLGVLKPYIGNRAVQWNQIDISEWPTIRMSRSDMEHFRLRKGDLLACEGGEVGRAAIWEAPLDECYYQKALHRLWRLGGPGDRQLVMHETGHSSFPNMMRSVLPPLPWVTVNQIEPSCCRKVGY